MITVMAALLCDGAQCVHLCLLHYTLRLETGLRQAWNEAGGWQASRLTGTHTSFSVGFGGLNSSRHSYSLSHLLSPHEIELREGLEGGSAG